MTDLLEIVGVVPPVQARGTGGEDAGGGVDEGASEAVGDVDELEVADLGVHGDAVERVAQSVRGVSGWEGEREGKKDGPVGVFLCFRLALGVRSGGDLGARVGDVTEGDVLVATERD